MNKINSIIDNKNSILLGLFFGVQICVIIHGQFSDTKFFGWVPYDQISIYHIQVSENDRKLTYDEIKNRYRKAPEGRENRNIHNLISLIKNYERNVDESIESKVILTFITNGHKKGSWLWPNDTIVYE